MNNFLKDLLNNEQKQYKKDFGYFKDLKIKSIEIATTEINKSDGAGYIQFRIIFDNNDIYFIWYDVWNINGDGYDFDFNQYIFLDDNENDQKQKELQNILLNYSDEISGLIDGVLYE